MSDDGIRDKLVAVKQAWARAGRLLTGNPDPDHAMRLPPGQRLVTNWPVLDLGIQPDVPKSEWRLTVANLSRNRAACLMNCAGWTRCFIRLPSQMWLLPSLVVEADLKAR